MTAISLFATFGLAGRLFKYISWTVYNMNYFLSLKSHGFKIIWQVYYNEMSHCSNKSSKEQFLAKTGFQHSPYKNVAECDLGLNKINRKILHV